MSKSYQYRLEQLLQRQNKGCKGCRSGKGGKSGQL
jgi:hypothetical protein